MSSSLISIIGSLLCSSICCVIFVLFFLLIIGMMVMRKKGKKKVSVKQAIQAGADASRAFVRGSKSREELLREAELEDDD